MNRKLVICRSVALLSLIGLASLVQEHKGGSTKDLKNQLANCPFFRKVDTAGFLEALPPRGFEEKRLVVTATLLLACLPPGVLAHSADEAKPVFTGGAEMGGTLPKTWCGVCLYFPHYHFLYDPSP